MTQARQFTAAVFTAILATGVSASAAPPASPAAGAALSGTTVSPSERELIARQLLREGAEQSLNEVLRQLQNSEDPPGQLAAARAIAMERPGDARFLLPLRLLMGVDRSLTDAAAQALAAYDGNPEALRLLINFAAARQQRDVDRMPAIRAMSAVADKAAAEFLIGLVLREDDSQRIRAAAADALIELTGQFQNGQDGRLWQAWWSATSSLTDQQWRQMVTHLQASRYVQMRIQYDQLISELQATLTKVYESTVPAQQASLVMNYLRSTHPEIRRIGAMIVQTDAMAARPVPPETKEQLRRMISDSSAEVRLAVAGAMLAASDPASLDAMLEQLSREPDPQVRAALAGPIASIGDLRAAPALRALLRDPSLSVATSAAAALRELGPIIRRQNPALAREVAGDLKRALEALPNGPGSVGFREAVAEAFIPLREPTSLPTLYELLREPGPARIRWAAIRALGELGDPKAADTISRYLEDSESGVRLEAVRALGKTSAGEYAEELYRRMNPVEETDPAVREEAWLVLRSGFEKMPLEQLAGWSTRFANDLARRSAVLTIVVRRHAASNDAARLAAARHALASTQQQMGEPSEAAANFRLALDYYRDQAGQEMIVEQLIDQYLQALLRGRDYRTASSYSSELLSGQASYQQTVGVLFRNEARRLLEEQRLVDLATLVATARSIRPPLAARYLDDIVALEKNTQQTQPAPSATTAPTTGP